MISDLLKNVAQLRSDAQDFRRKARQETDETKRKQLFESAEAEFQKAISSLERGLRTVRRQQSGYTADVCNVLEALSQSYGSLGGTLRDAGDREEARKKYEKGNVYEEERRQSCGAKDTYNMLQVLIVELLIKSARLEESGFLAKLNKVREEIDRQVNAGRDDSWALADLALARFLCGADADQIIADLEKRTAENTFYESTHTVVATLVKEGLGQGEQLGERLEKFERLLKRKGGIA
jgi:tetratricopeptide (TPR) repeat protein